MARSDELYTYLLGHTLATGENVDPVITFNVDDTAPYVGTGAIGRSGSQWVARWYTLVKFSEPNDDNTTKQENVTFGHITLEGEILIPKDGNWKKRETFATYAAAKAWLDGLAHIS